jgi:two-component system, NarL family, response regulator NreC
LEVVQRAAQRLPETRSIVLSMHANEAYVLQALQKGALGYVLKDSSDTDLVQAVREVVAGRRYLSPPLSDRAIRAYVQQAAPTAVDPYDRLTPREQEVFHLTAKGSSIAEIAARLTLSPRTVEAHRASFMRKLDLHSQGEVEQYAQGRGWL